MDTSTINVIITAISTSGLTAVLATYLNNRQKQRALETRHEQEDYKDFSKKYDRLFEERNEDFKQLKQDFKDLSQKYDKLFHDYKILLGVVEEKNNEIESLRKRVGELEDQLTKYTTV